ncbi:hypothetical protein C7H19_20090 [Aphanothece hegewaldii CCALA 016]|uniref:SAM-dependent methyltransferase n=1 Tax=Aphanothece hegewaldii CCALA 016 TaxID=2107694 RepID=A0A2T1LT48_9CHRO|nr:hypothetical protein [Aphanothece hegewaldii]PSF33472.1 hypothetical protein C7H19_20090 [Aphanothece hegewaldii CCALA 016]
MKNNIEISYLDYFPSPSWVCDYLTAKTDIQSPSLVLETSAGTGELAKNLSQTSAKIHCIELVPEFRLKLTQQGFIVVGSNFLTTPLSSYPYIVQNPPFSVQLSFIYKAYSLLTSEGKLVSLLSDAPLKYHRSVYAQFRNWCYAVNAVLQELPYGLFLNSSRSTSVQCYSLIINK